MRLAFDDRLIVTNHFDPEMAALADRHYSRRTIGARQFLYSGRKIVIRDALGDVLFGWVFPDPAMRMDGQTGYNCAIFRNESARRSSDIILECEAIAHAKWGPNRMYTYVNPAKIKSANPGYCFKQAGWTNCRNADGSIRVSVNGQHLLEKAPKIGDEVSCRDYVIRYTLHGLAVMRDGLHVCWASDVDDGKRRIDELLG